MNINFNIKQSHLVLLVRGQIFGAGIAPTRVQDFVATNGFPGDFGSCVYPYPSSFLVWVMGAWFCWCGGSWLGVADLSAIGATLSWVWLCQKVGAAAQIQALTSTKQCSWLTVIKMHITDETLNKNHVPILHPRE